MAVTHKPPLTSSLTKLSATLQDAKGDEELFAAIVNAPFENQIDAASMFLGIVVLLLVNKENGTIDRIAISNTDMASRAKQMSMKKFEDIRIPVGYHDNILAKAVATGKAQECTDWKYLFVPELTEEHARLNQADAGIAFSCVHPLSARDGGAMIFSFYQPKELMPGAYAEFMRRYVDLVDQQLIVGN